MTLVLKGGTLYLKSGAKISHRKKKAKLSHHKCRFWRLPVQNFTCPKNVSYKIYDVAADGNCFFYSLLRAMAAKGIPCSFGDDDNFNIRNTEASEPTDIFDGLIHDNLNLVKNDELEAGRHVREKLYKIFQKACKLYNQSGPQRKVSKTACINVLVENIRSMKNFDDPHKTLLTDLNTFGNYMDTGNPLLQQLIECALKVKVRVYNSRGSQWVDYLSNANPLDNDVVNIWFTGNHYKFMHPVLSSNFQPSGGLGLLRTLFEPPSSSSGSSSVSSSSVSSSSSNTTLSNDLQSLVDEGAITLQDAYQLMKSL